MSTCQALELSIKLVSQVLPSKMGWLKERKNRHLLEITRCIILVIERTFVHFYYFLINDDMIILCVN
jgi:hypothetical protein